LGNTVPVLAADSTFLSPKEAFWRPILMKYDGPWKEFCQRSAPDHEEDSFVAAGDLSEVFLDNFARQLQILSNLFRIRQVEG